MKDAYDCTDREEQKQFIRELIKTADNWLDNNSGNTDTTQLIQGLSHNLALMNLRVGDLLEGAENSKMYIDRYFTIVRAALNSEDYKIRDLKDLIFSF